MKYVFIIKKDEFLTPNVLDRFLKETSVKPSHVFLVNHKESKKYTKTSLKLIPLKNKIKVFFEIGLKSINPFSMSNIKALKKNNIPYSVLSSINQEVFETTIKKISPNYILNYHSEIFSKKMIQELPKTYNFHFGVLPKYKGRFPIFWAKLNHDKQGITCHEITPHIDGGPILNMIKIDAPQELDFISTMKFIVKSAPQFMVDCVKKLSKNDINPINVEEPNKEYFNYPTDKDIKSYFSKTKST